MDMNFFRLGAGIFKYLKSVLPREDKMQRKLDEQIESEIIARDNAIFQLSANTDVYLKKSKRDYKFCLRSRQYQAISEFQEKNDLSKAEISMALRTRLLKVSSKNKTIISRGFWPPSHTLIFGLVSLAASTLWYLCSKYLKLFAFADAFAIGLGNFLPAIIYFAISVFSVFYVISYYVDGYLIRARFREMKLLK